MSLCAAHPLDPPKHLHERRKERQKNLQSIHIDSDKACDAVGRRSVVEIPRAIMYEKTQLFPSSQLSRHLESFYDEVANIPESIQEEAIAKAKSLMDYIMPRASRLAIKFGVRLGTEFYSGSTFDGTQVISPKEIDIFLLLAIQVKRTEWLESGCKLIPLRKFRQKEGGKRDPWRIGRSEEGLYLSSMKVACNTYDIIDRALKLHPEARLRPFTVQNNAAQICVILKENYTINIIPAIVVEKDEAYLHTRPYSYDENPASDMLWRVSFVDKERAMLESMDLADRGVRRKTFKILKALAKKEKILSNLTSYHIKTVLLHTFDDDVDNTPRWQRDTLERCFMGILTELLHYLSIRNLPHFFVRDYNLFDNMDSRMLESLRARVQYLISNPRDIYRLLQKRSKYSVK